MTRLEKYVLFAAILYGCMWILHILIANSNAGKRRGSYMDNILGYYVTKPQTANIYLTPIHRQERNHDPILTITSATAITTTSATTPIAVTETTTTTTPTTSTTTPVTTTTTLITTSTLTLITTTALTTTTTTTFNFKNVSSLSQTTIINFNSSNNISFVDGPFRYPDRNSPVSVQLSLLPDLLNHCSSQKRILVIVIARPDNADLRGAIRQTWAKAKSNNTSIVFHVGKMHNAKNLTESARVNAEITKEAALYGDLLVSDIIEHYSNLTLKTYGSLLFVADHCQQATCVVKSDVDTVVNLRAIERLCQLNKNDTIFGHCFTSSPHRNPKSKWYVPSFAWHEEKYPKFCSGSAYVLVGANVTRRLLSAVNKTDFYRSENFRSLGEDVVWTGVVAEKANISRHYIHGFSPNKQLTFYCFEGGQKMPITVHYAISRGSVLYYWQLMNRPRKC